MTKKWFWSVLGMLILTAALQGQSRESVLKAVAESSEWSAADKPTDYNDKNIEVLAGKRASTVNRYGLIGATRQTWMGPNGTVRMTLYEMTDATAAYGLFSLERNIDQPGFEALPLGAEGYRLGNRSFFWQSKYVVQIDGNASAADSLARTVSRNIFGSSRKPPVSSHLPPQNLVQGSEKYVLDATGLGREFDVDPQILGFDDSVEVATAHYRVEGKPARLMLLLYPTQQLAKKYADQWKAQPSSEEGFRKRVGAVLAVIRGSDDPGVAKAILDGVNYESQVTWNERRPDISIREVILTIFSFIGVALLFTFVAGLSFGGLRIFIKSRYPNRIFDRAGAMEIIQLKLDEGLTRKELRE